VPSVIAYATPAAKEPFAKTTIQRRETGPNDIVIAISYAGICHSDIHTAREEWGTANFPLVPGHEIVGIVEAVGSEVTRHAVGDRVGVGCMVNSCGECAQCTRGEEQFCLNGSVGTYNSLDRDGTYTAGGYSTHVVIDERFVLSIPEGIELDVAAPLLCAGITVYSPLNHWNAGPGKKVAVVGLGGLGHMAVKLGSAMGAEVTVLSQSLRKQEDGLRFGAKDFYATSDRATFKELADHFDLIINTVSASFNVDRFLSLLAVDGTLVNVGAPEEPLTVNVFSLLKNRRSFAGSPIGGIAETQQMLDFCAAKGIGAEVEVITADQIDDAYNRVVDSDVRYRFVIDIASMKG
jgi:uncharacterized zinc-type alcohol dehydrogenase-like protein